jgi:hypothetical protein
MTVIAGVALVALYFMSGNKAAAAEAKLDVIETNARRSVAEKKRRIAKLQKDKVANAAQISKVESDLAAQKEKLNAKFERQGLSADDIAARFRRIRL